MGDNISSPLDLPDPDLMMDVASRTPKTDTLLIDGVPLDNPRKLGDFLWEFYQADDSPDRGLILDGAIRETQVAVDLEQDSKDHAQLLFDLGVRLDARVDMKGDLADHNRAISALWHAAELTDDNDQNKTERLNLLGLSLMKRFERLGEIDDFNTATAAFCRAVESTPDDDSCKPAILGNYGASLRKRFERIGEPRDIELSIAALNRAVGLQSDEDSSNPLRLSSLASSHLARFNLSGQLADLEQALVIHRRAVELAPAGHPALPLLCNGLGTAFAKQFERSGKLEDLDQAVSAHRRALELTPEGHSEKPVRLNNWGSSLFARAECSGKLEDFEQAISAHRRAVELTPDGHIDKPSRWNNLGCSLLARYERSGDLEDLDQSISAHTRAVELTPDGHVDKPSLCTNLGGSFFVLYERSRDLEALEQAISVHTRAVELTPEGQSSNPALLNNRGSSLLARYERLGDLEDLEQAIAIYRHAVDLRPDGHPDKPLSLNNLGNALARRFERMQELEDVTGAILALGRALELTPMGHPEKASRFSNLGNALYRRFESFGEFKDLEGSYTAHRRAVELTTDNDPEKPMRLSQLCADLCSRFEELTHDHDDLASAIAVGRRAIALLPKDHPKLVFCCPILALCLRTRFENVGDIEDLKAAILLFQQTEELVVEGDPIMSLIMQDLGGAQLMLFQSTRAQTDFDAAAESFVKATMHPSGTPLGRLNSARRWALMLSEQPTLCTTDSLLSAHSRIIAILPEIVWLGHSIRRRYEDSTHLGRLVNGSVSVAIASGSLVQAVEWLDAGRALIWSQVLSLRTPLDELQASHPRLAASLRTIGQQLQTTAYTAYAPSIDNFGGIAGIKINSAADCHRELVITYDKVLKTIRGCPGFEDFLRPKRLEALVPSPKLMSGPIVFVNVHRNRSDAMILHVGGAITTVPLTELSSERASQLRSLWIEGFAVYRNRTQDSASASNTNEYRPRDRMGEGPIYYRHTSRVDDDEGHFVRLLEHMWRWIVNPILESIDLPSLTHGTFLPHVTWCPTGPLMQLPFHAAGIYRDPHGPRAFDFVVSSYTPSLSAFLRCAEGTAKQRVAPGSVLIVTQPETPGHFRLPETRTEGLRLQGVLDEAHISSDIYNHEQATVNSIQTVMDQFSWVHLACHGSQNREDATKSAFELFDGPLTLSNLMGTVAENAELAFLSACQTAVGDERTPEESAHLAAGMLSVGFKGVIATMLSIQDVDAPIIVEAYYKELLALRSTGHLGIGETGAAYALHAATRKLREQVDETSFMRWVPFVHFGV